MTNYYLGQIGIYGFNFNPRGWALAKGDIIPLAQNTALYSLLGTTYGGNGQTTFGLPDLRGRTPMAFGQLTSMGEMTGTESVTLLITEMPYHSHAFMANNSPGTQAGLQDGVFAAPVNGKTGAAENFYFATGPNVVLNPQQCSVAGGSQAHNNIQPSLGLNFCIATTGYYPARN
ncbi:MAG: tail fiber protein [Rhizomicrobium sp.]